jgi:transposase
MQIEKITTQNLDHLGLVAGIIQDLGLIEKIDQRLPIRKDAAVTMGQRAAALIINGLGFTDERLYLVADFFANRPVERLIGKGVKAEYLNDDSLGRFLDAVYEYGATKLFCEIAFEIGLEQGLLGKNAHVDTTTFSLHGKYEIDGQKIEAVHINRGYAKNKRFDLKQLVLGLTTCGASGFPCWAECFNGNTSDKESLHKMVQRMQQFSKELKKAPVFRWIADASFYCKEKLLAAGNMEWTTRVPETISEAKELLGLAENKIRWQKIDESYAFSCYKSNYGGIEQRWVLVRSTHAYERERETLRKKMKRERETLIKDLWHLSNQVFACEPDAIKAANNLAKKSNYYKIVFEVNPQERFLQPGRPKKGVVKDTVGCCISGKLQLDITAVKTILNRKGRFILATNESENTLPNELLLAEYKKQSHVETGFKFFKDPWFMVDSVFLKNAARIEALMVTMTLCLMVYRVGEYRLRKQLELKQESLPNQVRKEIKNPTLRWVFKLFQGIAVISYRGKEKCYQAVSNITALRERIIRYFGENTMKIYGLSG